MITLCCYFSPVHDNKPICLGQRRQTVRYNNADPVPDERLHSTYDLMFGLHIDCRQAVINDKNLPVGQKRPCQCNSLPLTAGELYPPLSYPGIIAFR